MIVRPAMLALVLLAVGGGAAAQPTPSPSPQARPRANAGAMYEFLLARRAEGRDDAKEAESALTRAVALDPQSAELQAELAAFYARQNRASEAARAAERALALDAASEEGHRVLGLVNAAWADGVIEGPAGGSERAWRETAIAHLEKVQGSPAMATDLGLQMTLARQLLAAERASDAVPILERVVTQTGPAGEPASMLAEAHRALNQLDRAEAVLERAAAASPRYYLALGDVYERQGKFEEAADAFDKGARALRTPGRELRLRRVAALLNIPDGKGAARAVAALDEYLAGAPKDVAGLSLLARAHALRKDDAALVAAANRALAVDQRHLPTLGLLAAHYRDRYDFAAIVPLLSPLETTAGAATAPGSATERVRLLAELGAARQQVGDAAGAVRAFQEAQRLAPDAAPVAAALAHAHLQAGQPAEAARVATAARRTAPTDLGLIRVEAMAGVRAGHAAEAVRAAETAVGDRRTEADGAFVLADVYQEARRHTDAVGVLTPLAEARPDDVDIQFRLGAAYETAGRIGEAERVFRGILGRDPLHANALNYLGYMLANRGLKLAEALALVDRALAVEPDNPAFLDSRGWALFKLGRVTDAEPPLKRAASALGGSSAIQAHYADILAALGRRTEAADRIELALKGDGVDVDRAVLERRLLQLGRRPR